MKKLTILIFALLVATFTSCNSTDRTFIGSWKFAKIVPLTNPNDHSLDATIINIKKYPNTSKSYSLELFGNEIIFTEKDENTLVGQNSSIVLQYDPTSKLLKLIMGSDSEIYFSKLE
jgi:hypothetical protein